MATLEQDCKEYTELLDSPQNGLGQNYHPVYGQSHNMLRVLYERHGKDNVNQVLDVHY